MKLSSLFRGRIGRKNFLLGLVLFAILEGIATIPTYLIFFSENSRSVITTLSKSEFQVKMSQSFMIHTPEGIIFLALSLLVVLWSLTIYVRRLHDVGRSGKLASLVLVEFIANKTMPYVGLFYLQNNYVNLQSVAVVTLIPGLFGLMYIIVLLYLLFTKTTPSANQYGEIPSGKISVKNILFNK